MSSEWPRMRASELEARGDLFVQDGNHGEYRPRPDEFTEDGIPFIRAGDVQEGRVIFERAARINEVAFKRIRKGIAHPLDIILTTKGTVGNIAIAGGEYDTFVCSPQTTFWRATTGGGLHHRFLYYFMQSREFIKQVKGLKDQTDMAPYLSLTEQRNMWVRVPRLSIQCGIADILGALDDKLECNRRTNLTLETMARTLYKHLFVDASEANTQPLTDLIDIGPAVSIARGAVTTYVDMKALPTGSMSVTETAQRPFNSGSKFQNGDTLFARITPCLENGKTAFVDFLEDREAGFGSTEFIVLRAKEDVSPQFVYCCARDERVRAHAIKSMVGTSGRQRVRSECFSRYFVKKICPEAMRHFDEQTALWFKQIRANVKESQTLVQTRDYLVPKLLSGEITVKAAEEQMEALV